MIPETKSLLEKALHHLEVEFGKLQAGRANPALVEDIRVEQYGMLQPLKNCASVNVLDNQTLSIQPWDKTLIHPIAKAISDAGVGLNAQSMADSVMIKIPDLTEERRRDIVKIVKRFAEEAKVTVRNIRGDTLKKIKADESFTEDMQRDMEKDLQKLVDDINKAIDEAAKKKEADVMKV